MAAAKLIRYNCSICLIESMPTIGRKFLMAGKLGLNITSIRKNFIHIYGGSKNWITPMIHEFGPPEIIYFCQSLGQEIFVGSSGRVFPKSMKSLPMLRAWSEKLRNSSVDIRTSSRWIDFKSTGKSFLCNGDVIYSISGNNKNYFIKS